MYYCEHNAQGVVVPPTRQRSADGDEVSKMGEHPSDERDLRPRTHGLTAGSSDESGSGRALWEDVERLAEHLQVSSETVMAALERIVAAAVEQGRKHPRTRERVVEALLDDLDLRGSVPQPVVDQAHRVAARRRRLVEYGAWSVSDLAEVRDASVSAVHTWLGRQRDADRLFTVSAGRETYVPALLLDEAAEPYEGLEQVVGPLKQAGMDAWALWVWFDTPSGWLDGQRPADLIAAGAVERVARAAHDKAATAAQQGADSAA